MPLDIQGSIVHATMLGRQGIITQDEANTIIRGLRQVSKEIEDSQFIFDTVDEDIHMAIERRMTEIIGPVGGKLHGDEVVMIKPLLILKCIYEQLSVKFKRILPTCKKNN